MNSICSRHYHLPSQLSQSRFSSNMIVETSFFSSCDKSMAFHWGNPQDGVGKFGIPKVVPYHLVFDENQVIRIYRPRRLYQGRFRAKYWIKGHMAYRESSMKIHSSVFWKVANRQIDKQTYQQVWKHNLRFGVGNYIFISRFLQDECTYTSHTVVRKALVRKTPEIMQVLTLVLLGIMMIHLHYLFPILIRRM